MSQAPSSARAGSWSLAPSALPRLLGGGVLLLVGLLTGRPDVAALGAPLVLSAVWGVLQRPTGAASTALTQPRHVPSRSRITATLVLEPAPRVATARLRAGAQDHGDVEVLVDVRQRRELHLSLVTARTGRQDVFRVDRIDADAAAVLRSPPTTVGPRSVLVLPQATPLRELPLPPRLQGLTGSHRSSRPGDGGELRDIAVFGAGDRLRRIDWKATARRAGSGGGHGAVTELYVHRTFATSDAHVLLVVDARDAVGPEVTGWDRGITHPDDVTSLDVARRAAASMARRYLEQGDRVGLLELGGSGRRLRPAGGRRHLNQVMHHLALSAPEGKPRRLARTPQIPSNALVILFSTFLDETPVQLARQWRYSAHRTVAVDVTPAADTGTMPPRIRNAYRLVQLEREERLADLRAAGVEVVSFPSDPADGSEAAIALAALARQRRVRR